MSLIDSNTNNDLADFKPSQAAEQAAHEQRMAEQDRRDAALRAEHAQLMADREAAQRELAAQQAAARAEHEAWAAKLAAKEQELEQQRAALPKEKLAPAAPAPDDRAPMAPNLENHAEAAAACAAG